MDRAGVDEARAHEPKAQTQGRLPTHQDRSRVALKGTISQLPARVATPAVDLVLSSDTTAVVKSGADHLEVQTTLNGHGTGAKRCVDRAIAELAHTVRPPAVGEVIVRYPAAVVHARADL